MLDGAQYLTKTVSENKCADNWRTETFPVLSVPLLSARAPRAQAHRAYVTCPLVTAIFASVSSTYYCGLRVCPNADVHDTRVSHACPCFVSSLFSWFAYRKENSPTFEFAYLLRHVFVLSDNDDIKTCFSSLFRA